MVTGVVTSIKARSVWVHINFSPITALAFQDRCADTPKPDLAKLYAVGDSVKALVLDVDKGKHQVTLSLRPSDLPAEEEEDVVVQEMESEDEMVPLAMRAQNDDDDDSMLLESEEEEDENDNDDDDENEDDDDDDNDDDSGDEDEDDDDDYDYDYDDDDDNIITASSSTTGGFGWDDLGETSVGDKDASTSPSSSASKKSRKLSEKEIAAMERSLASADAVPSSEPEFERLLIAHPSSSHMWLQYASYLLSLTEVAKARAVLRRGLKNIPVHLEEERSNLWWALLNLEAEYGDEDSLEALYKEVKQKMDDKTAALHLAGIYETKKQYANAYNLWKQLAKDYKQDVDVWSGWCAFYFKQGEFDKSGEILKRALSVLSKNEKSHMLTSYAVLLYKYGKFDQGRTIFEDLLSKLPKRLDLWNVYVDQEIKVDHVEFVRSLFRRMVEIKTSVNKIKGVFKKWLAFEDQHGDEESVKKAEEMVQEYINRLTA